MHKAGLFREGYIFWLNNESTHVHKDSWKYILEIILNAKNLIMARLVSQWSHSENSQFDLLKNNQMIVCNKPKLEIMLMIF